MDTLNVVDISAYTSPTVKYDLRNCIRIVKLIHLRLYIGDFGPDYT